MRVKRTQRDSSLLVGYRETRGGKEMYGVCPADKVEEFAAEELVHHARGEPCPSPTVLYPRPSRETRRATKKRQAAIARTKRIRLSEWISTDNDDPERILLFDLNPEPGAHQRHAYTTAFINDWKPYIGDPFIDEDALTNDMVQRMVKHWTTCGHCGKSLYTDKRSCDDHVSSRRRETLERKLGLLHAAMRQAIKGGHRTTNPCAGINISKNLREPAARNADEEALSSRRLDDLVRAHPPLFQVIPATLAGGMLRRGEGFGLNRGSLIPPPETDPDAPAGLVLSHTYIQEEPGGPFVLVPRAKTDASLDDAVLSNWSWRIVRRHLDEFRSTPSPETCAACAAGMVEAPFPTERRGLRASLALNPHERCDFADDAPLFIDEKRNRLDPDRYTNHIMAVAAIAAHLDVDDIGFRPTPKTLRMTGATLLLEAGVPLEVVKTMGRWTNVATLERHYKRIRKTAQKDAMAAFDVLHSIALGGDVPSAATAEERERLWRARAQHLEAKAASLEARLGQCCGTSPGMTSAPLRALTLHAAAGTLLSPFDDPARVATAVAGASSRKQILQALGVSVAGKNYARLAMAAERDGLILPPVRPHYRSRLER